MGTYNVYCFGGACDFDVPLPKAGCYYWSDIAYVERTNGQRELLIPRGEAWVSVSMVNAHKRLRVGGGG